MKRRNIILIHALYWFYIANQSLFPMYVGKVAEQNMPGGRYLLDVIISLLLNAVSFYTVYFVFPRITAIRRKLLIIPAAALLVAGLTVVRLPAEWYFWKYFGTLPGKEMTFEWIWVWNELRLVIITSIYSILIRYMINAFEAQKIRDELINQRQAGELALLKSQVNPHFLFNTLNNIYSLVYRKSDEAPEAVMKFSSIMRYVLYDTNTEKVDLEKEIDYLKSYVELERLRIKRPDFVQMLMEGVISGWSIAPMLLIPFVENAFKHGSKEHLPGIMIHLTVTDSRLTFRVENYLRKHKQLTESLPGNMGIANIRRRLELIYPARHQLDIREENGFFKVNLIIER